MLGGAAPIPASLGQTVRYRLNRGGDRQLNCALHTIVLSRLMHDPAGRPATPSARPHPRHLLFNLRALEANYEPRY